MPKTIIKKAKSITKTKVKTSSKKKTILSKAAYKRIHMPSKPKQIFSIANNGRKVRHGTSIAEKLWLDRLGVPERSKIIILFGKTYVIDGFDPKTNTCYEYLGNFAHGAHNTYPTNRNVKTWLGKTPNELYYGTIQRFQILNSCSFKIFFVWESDYKKGKTIGRYYKGNTDNLY